jgi:peptidoglycan/xylan/chitin deacetylase (PgdA/CDA1 family)
LKTDLRAVETNGINSPQEHLVITLMTTLLNILTLFSLALISVAFVSYKPPQWLIHLLQRRYPDVLFCVPTDRKILALTIDDGPSPYTSEIKQILATYDFKATFFLIGSNIPDRKAILKDLFDNGHELANHAMHDEPSINLSPEELTCQLRVVEQEIAKVYKSTSIPTQQPKYFRPGSGFFNTTLRHVVKSLDYWLILGSIYPWDAQISWPRLNAWHILSSVRPGGVIVIHERKSTLEMLEIVLPQLKRREWTVTTVTELLQLAHDGKRS